MKEKSCSMASPTSGRVYTPHLCLCRANNDIQPRAVSSLFPNYPNEYR